jgi:hypothetical protein
MGVTSWTIGGWTAYMGFPAPADEFGCTWWATVEEGWRTPPAPRIERVVRPRRHGEVDPYRTWLPARTVDLKGLVEAPDHAGLAAAGDRFAGLLAHGYLATLVVDEDGDVRQADTRLADAPEFVMIHPRLATWTLPLLMPDPLRYAAGTGTIATTSLPAAEVGLVVPITVPLVISVGGTSGRVVLDNLGTAPTTPSFRITGPVVNPRIEHATTGAVLAFVTALGASDYIDVYPATGEVLLNGAENARGALAVGSSPVTSISFPVGSNEVYYRALSSSGGSTLTVSFRSAYF